MNNSSAVKFITLSGLQEARMHKYIYFSLTLVFYLLIILINLIVILTICLEKGLHEPMYIFLSNLCINGLYGTAGFYPKFLLDLLSDVHVILFSWCMTQVFVIYTSVMCEISLLTVMAYDRYVAICRPLQYHAILTPRMVAKLLLYAWLFPLAQAFIALILSLRLPLCGSHIDKLYCDNGYVMKLSCVPVTANIMWAMVIVSLHVVHILLIIYTYWQIVRACLKSREGQTKFMETCLPHLLSLANVIIATMFDHMYSRYNSEVLPLSLRNFMAVEMLVIPPLLNPIAYGLKMKQIRSRVFRIISRVSNAGTFPRN